MNISSFTYRRFLKDSYLDFIERHFIDIIDFLEQDEDHTFEQYLLENEISREVELNFSYVLSTISKELSLIYLDSTIAENESDIEIKVYDDLVMMIKVKLKDVILDSSAYYHLANRLN